jgi:hypothetical protein
LFFFFCFLLWGLFGVGVVGGLGWVLGVGVVVVVVVVVVAVAFDE